MPLQETASVQSRGSKLKQKTKHFFTRAGAMLVVLIVALTCAVPALSASAFNSLTVDPVATHNHVIYFDTSTQKATNENETWGTSNSDYNECNGGLYQVVNANDHSEIFWEYDCAAHNNDKGRKIAFKIQNGTISVTSSNMFVDYLTVGDNIRQGIINAGDDEKAMKNACLKYGLPYGGINNASYALKSVLKNTAGISLYSICTGKYSGDTSLEGVIRYGNSLNFTYDTGVTLNDLLNDMGTALKAWIAPAVGSSYAGAIVNMNETIERANKLLTRPLDGNTDVSEGGHWDSGKINANGSYGAWVPTDETSVNNTIYRVCANICNNVILPIAGVMLAFVFAYEIYEIVCERNNMNDIGSGTFIQLIIKMAIAILVVVNAWTLTQAVFSIGQILVQSASELQIVNSEGSSGLLSQVDNILKVLNDQLKSQGGSLIDISSADALKWAFTYYICADASIDFGTILVMFLQGIIINIGMYIVSLIVSIIIYVRMIEIYLYMSLAPIPLATLTNRSWSMVGMNYIRAIIALALQAILIFLCLELFNVMVSEVISNIGEDGFDITGEMWSVIGYSIILVFCLFKSGGLSKSIMNAH